MLLLVVVAIFSLPFCVFSSIFSSQLMTRNKRKTNEEKRVVVVVVVVVVILCFTPSTYSPRKARSGTFG
jgi:hypothetical protein